MATRNRQQVQPAAGRARFPVGQGSGVSRVPTKVGGQGFSWKQGGASRAPKPGPTADAVARGKRMTKGKSFTYG